MSEYHTALRERDSLIKQLAAKVSELGEVRV